MTKEDKKLISEYMGWKYYPSGDYYINPLSVNCWGIVVFDLNDAGLCVQEMQKRGEWVYFYDDLLDTYNGLCEDGKVSCGAENFTAWVFNADNFFKAFTEWRKGIKLDPVIDKESAAYMDN